MKFIFPQNYNFNTKLLGIIDYPTAILNFACWIIIFLISKIFEFSLLITIILFISICFPLLLISIFGFHQENILYVFRYMLMFFKSPKIYLYRKEI